MRLNSLKPTAGSKKNRKRVGRGIGCGSGKTCGRGHKGQRSRSGGYHKVGFEGGQMPLQRRLPKYGFSSTTSAHVDEVRLHEIAKVAGDTVDLISLKAADLIRDDVKKVRIMVSGKIERALIVRGLGVSKGARAAIEAAGGRIEE